jgi:hypothetical protein
LDYAVSGGLEFCSRFTTSKFASAVWKTNFKDATDEVISTWAYRWTASLWKNGLFCVSPNRNLVSYTGADSGTHTRTRPTWSELPIGDVFGLVASLPNEVKYDRGADAWLERSAMRSSFLGSIRRQLESLGLRFLKRIRRG